MKKTFIIISSVIILVVFDQLSKLIVINTFSHLETRVLIPNFLKFSYIKNNGISFGLFGGKQLIIILLTIVIIAFMINEYIKNKNNKIITISTILILGGAFGNLIDRSVRGYVIDFISFTLFNREMAIFNLADTFITLGVIVYIINLIMEGKNERVINK